jgi:hypothetical protein
VEILLTPKVVDANQIQLDSEVGRVDADGTLGEVLRSGSAGAALRDKIRESLLKAIRKSAALDAVLPERARPFAALESAAFADAGNGRLALNVTARLAVPGGQVSGLVEQLRNRK